MLLDHYRILAFILALKQGGQHLPDATLSQLEVDVSCGGLVHVPCLALQRQSTILAVRGTASSVELKFSLFCVSYLHRFIFLRVALWKQKSIEKQQMQMSLVFNCFRFCFDAVR